jgi:hypothetical protein
MNVDLTKPLTILEGPIDSLAVASSIALQSAAKHLDGFFDEIETVRYIFDNDKTGREMTLKKLKEHRTVFLWGKYLDMINSKVKVKDLNDLQKTNQFNRDILEQCFTDDEFDAMYI